MRPVAANGCSGSLSRGEEGQGSVCASTRRDVHKHKYDVDYHVSSSKACITLFVARFFTSKPLAFVKRE